MVPAAPIKQSNMKSMFGQPLLPLFTWKEVPAAAYTSKQNNEKKIDCHNMADIHPPKSVGVRYTHEQQAKKSSSELVLNRASLCM